MDIDKYLKLTNLSKDEYKEIRFNDYKKKYGNDLQEYQFENMIKYNPDSYTDFSLYSKYLKKTIKKYT